MMKDMSKYIADLQEQLKAQRDNTGTATKCNKEISKQQYTSSS